jgi:hypothetical protein
MSGQGRKPSRGGQGSGRWPEEEETWLHQEKAHLGTCRNMTIIWYISCLLSLFWLFAKIWSILFDISNNLRAFGTFLKTI